MAKHLGPQYWTEPVFLLYTIASDVSQTWVHNAYLSVDVDADVVTYEYVGIVVNAGVYIYVHTYIERERTCTYVPVGCRYMNPLG